MKSVCVRLWSSDTTVEALAVRGLMRSTQRHESADDAEQALMGMVPAGIARRVLIGSIGRGGQPNDEFELVGKRPNQQLD